MPDDTVLADRSCMVLMGTAVRRGRGRAVVTHTGDGTAFGGIAAEAGAAPSRQTPLQSDLDRLGRRLGGLALAVALLVFLLGLLRDLELSTLFLTTVALAVAAIPEGLPAVATITLANGVRSMARHAAIVRRLSAVETLGSATVICTDKTGTLTRREIGVRRLVLADGRRLLEDADPSRPEVGRYAQIAALCNDVDSDGVGDPIDAALLRSVEALGASPETIRAEHPRVTSVPFESERMRMATVHDEAGARWWR